MKPSTPGTSPRKVVCSVWIWYGLALSAVRRCEATSVIIDLFERHGQGGNAVYANGFVARYHNSFIVADAREAYVLETSAPHWICRRTESSRRSRTL